MARLAKNVPLRSLLEADAQGAGAMARALTLVAMRATSRVLGPAKNAQLLHRPEELALLAATKVNALQACATLDFTALADPASHARHSASQEVFAPSAAETAIATCWIATLAISRAAMPANPALL